MKPCSNYVEGWVLQSPLSAALLLALPAAPGSCVCVCVCVCVALETKTQNNKESQKILPPLKSKNKKNETGSTQQQRFKGQLLHSFLSQFMSVFQHALQLRASMRSAVAQHLHPVSHSTLLLLLMTTFQELCKCPHRALPLPHVCATVVP